MRKLFFIISLIFCFTVYLTACQTKDSSKTEKNVDSTSEKTDSSVNNHEQKPDNSATNKSADKIRSFIVDAKDTYGWKTAGDEITLDFLEDGRLHIQGSDGEASMSEGKWSLDGDQLTMKRPDLKTTKTITVKIEGDKLLLGGVVYDRIRM